MQALGQVSELVFIPGNGPVLTSKAYLATRLDAHHSDSLFAALPLAQRLAFNNAIIRNSLARTIATKTGTWPTKPPPSRGAPGITTTSAA